MGDAAETVAVSLEKICERYRRLYGGVVYDVLEGLGLPNQVLSHELGLETIAEGVERADSEAYLQTIGCRFGQGFRYAAAMPVSEAVTWVYRPPE